MKVYIIGSLRNPKVTQVAADIRASGFDVFDDWMAAGPEADDFWMRYEKERGHTLKEALKGEAAQNVFNFDKRHLDAADVVVLVAPAGKSGHLELGYCLGKGKLGLIQLEGDPERFDVMYAFATAVTYSTEETLEFLKPLQAAGYSYWRGAAYREGA